MLDWARLVPQVEAMAAAQRAAREDLDARARAGRQALAAADAEALRARARAARPPWLAAVPLEPPLTACPPPPRPPAYVVAAADGSQIYPDRHRVIPCYLINVGTVLLRYGAEARAELASEPTLHFRPEEWEVADPAGPRRPVDEEAVGARRARAELAALAALAARAGREGLPAVALVDGTLILWHLWGKPEAVQQEGLAALVRLLEAAREARVPVAGYLSAPRAADVAKLARLALCPLATPACEPCAAAGGPPAGAPPCAAAAGPDDALLLAPVLAAPGARSALFASRSEVLARYPAEQAVCFFYLNVGGEVARVEVPRWVAEEPALVDLVHAVVLDQAEKGRGYPVALDEAHRQAVVDGGARRAFHDLVARALARRGLPVTASGKYVAKRTGVL